MPKKDPIDLIQQAADHHGWAKKRLTNDLFNGNRVSASKYLNRRVRLPAAIALLANSLLGTEISEQERISYTITPYPSAGKK